MAIDLPPPILKTKPIYSNHYVELGRVETEKTVSVLIREKLNKKDLKRFKVIDLVGVKALLIFDSKNQFYFVCKYSDAIYFCGEGLNIGRSSLDDEDIMTVIENIE